MSWDKTPNHIFAASNIHYEQVRHVFSAFETNIHTAATFRSMRVFNTVSPARAGGSCMTRDATSASGVRMYTLLSLEALFQSYCLGESLV